MCCYQMNGKLVSFCQPVNQPNLDSRCLWRHPWTGGMRHVNANVKLNGRQCGGSQVIVLSVKLSDTWKFWYETVNINLKIIFITKAYLGVLNLNTNQSPWYLENWSEVLGVNEKLPLYNSSVNTFLHVFKFCLNKLLKFFFIFHVS